jgi:hypothetical protein
MSGKILVLNTFGHKSYQNKDKLLPINKTESEPIRIKEKREEFANKVNEAIKNNGLKWIENF